MRTILVPVCFLLISLSSGLFAQSLDPHWTTYDLIEDPTSGEILVIDAGAVYRTGADRELNRIAGGAPFTLLVSLTLDSESGDIYVADALQAAVYRIDRTGQVTTFLSSEMLSRPVAVEWDAERRSLAVLDRGRRTLIVVGSDGEISTLFRGEPLTDPIDIVYNQALDSFWIIEDSGRLHELDFSGRLRDTQELEGIEEVGRIVQDQNSGDLLITDWRQGKVFRRTSEGVLTVEAQDSASAPVGILQKSEGSLFISDLSQGQISQIGAALTSSEGEPGGIQFAAYSDVPSNHWAYQFVEWFSELGITAGCGAGLFCPSGNVTRDQMAVFIVKLYKLLTVGDVNGDFFHPPAYRAEQTISAPNVIAGAADNFVGLDVVGATIAGGGSDYDLMEHNNRVTANYGTIGGGSKNLGSGNHSTIGEGNTNEARSLNTTISGGRQNVVNSDRGTIGGGEENVVDGENGVISGGRYNQVTGNSGSVGGGAKNIAGQDAVVPGGVFNEALGNYSFAAGRRAKANHQGSFVLADSTDADYGSVRNDALRVRFNGGTTFEVNNSSWVRFWERSGRLIETSVGAYLTTGGTWTNGSDRNSKENFLPVDRQAILDRVSQLPLSNWNYKAEDSSIRHIGPTAQDFHAAFGLGDSDKSISTIDSDGVALAAMQALYERVQEQEKKIEQLQRELGKLGDLKKQ